MRIARRIVSSYLTGRGYARELRAQVREWIDEWKKLKTLIAKMGDAQRACLQTLKKNRKRSSKLP